jgi:hypothetical protein
MPLDVSRLAPQVEEKWKIHPGGTENDEAPTSPKNLQEKSGASMRAIQDSNLWPLAPEANALSS